MKKLLSILLIILFVSCARAQYVAVSGQVTKNGLPVTYATVTATGTFGAPVQAMTNPFGYYEFDLFAGFNFVIQANHKSGMSQPVFFYALENTTLNLVIE